MAGDAGQTRRRPTVRFEARCAWCGPVRLGPAQLMVHAGAEVEGMLEFVCPSCGRLNLRGLERSDLTVLSGAGVDADALPAPFELLERRSGPPITWDDLIDFHEALSRLEAGTDTTRDAGRAAAEQERHAA